MKHIKKFEALTDKEEAEVDVLRDLFDANPLSKDHDFYLFIGRYNFEETYDGLYKKVLEIENMVKITPDRNSINNMSGLRMRVMVQHDNSLLYHIWLPKNLESYISGKGTPSIEKWIVDLIDKYKMSGKGKDVINPHFDLNKELENAIKIRKELRKYNL